MGKSDRHREYFRRKTKDAQGREIPSWRTWLTMPRPWRWSWG
ncbi:hypothetical protein OG866_01215 [Streptomyces sp. NBC_00663]|nr:hypothetical protein [Streptomyces sp. NBC_00663]